MTAQGRSKMGSIALFHTCLLVLLVSAVLAVPVMCSAQEDVHVFITGPDSLPVNTTVEYTIRITGGPADEQTGVGNFSYKARMEGDEDPPWGELKPQEGESANNTFTINVKTPENAQTLSLIVNGSSSVMINETVEDIMSSGEVIKTIEVFTPIIVDISATIRNTGASDVEGAVITFYVDGEKIGNTTVDIAANLTGTVNMDWVASKDEVGVHEVEVRINEEGGLLEFTNSDNVLTKTIYIGDRPERERRPIMFFSNGGLMVVLNLLAILFLFGAFMMRRNTVRGRAYYTPTQNGAMYFMGTLMIALSLPFFYVADVLFQNPDAAGDPWVTSFAGTLLFALGLLIVLLTWDRVRKKRR